MVRRCIRRRREGRDRLRPGATCGNVALYGLTVNRYTGLMTNPNDDFPEVRLSDVLFGSNGFPDWGPRTELSDAVIADGIARLSEFLPPEPEPETAEARKARQAQFRAAQEIRAAHADPNWLEP